MAGLSHVPSHLRIDSDSAYRGGMTHRGDVGTEISPASADDPELARRIDDLLHRTCDLARALTGAEQAALNVTLDAAGPRKFFNLSERYARWRGYRVDPHGLGLHGLAIAPGEVVRLSQAEVEAHPAWRACLVVFDEDEAQ
jgi:hypothetical protein